MCSLPVSGRTGPGIGCTDRSVRAGSPTVAAAHTFRAVGRAVDCDIQLAGLLAGAAGGAFVCINTEPVDSDRIKQPVDCTERAKIAAERTPEHDAQQDQHDQDRSLPGEQPAERRTQRRVGGNQWNAREQRAGRADVLAEPRLSLADDVQHGQRQDYDKTDQHGVFQTAQSALAGQTAQLFYKRDFVQQILYQPERAQPAADQPTEQCAEQKQETKHIKGKFVLPAGNDGLQ